jgi:hypothetical protein
MLSPWLSLADRGRGSPTGEGVVHTAMADTRLGALRHLLDSKGAWTARLVGYFA